MYWLCLSLATGFEVWADFYFKKASYLIGFSLYAVGTMFWAFTLQHKELSSAIITFTVINLLAVFFVGIFFLEEEVNPNSVMGIMFALLAIAFIEM